MKSRPTAIGGEGLAGPLHHGRRASIGLQTSPSAATALPGIGHFDFHVADLRAVAVFSLDDQIADDDATANARAQRKEYHAVHVFAGSDPEFAIGGRVGVVLESSGKMKSVFDILADRDVSPGLEVGRVEDKTGGNIHGAGRGHPDGGDLIEADSGRRHRLANGFRHLSKPVLLALSRFRGQGHRA